MTILELAKTWCECKMCVPVPVYKQFNLVVHSSNEIEGGFLARCSKSGEKCCIEHFLCASVALPAGSPLRTPAWVASALRHLLFLTLPEAQLRYPVQGGGADGAARHLQVGCCMSSELGCSLPFVQNRVVQFVNLRIHTVL